MVGGLEFLALEEEAVFEKAMGNFFTTVTELYGNAIAVLSSGEGIPLTSECRL